MEKKNKVDMLNILRLLAFVIVFLRHTKIFVPVSWSTGVSKAWILYTPAWAGVWIFFILAGYGIGAGFFSGKYKLSADGIIKYYIKRFASIVPVYWFYLLIVFVFIKPILLLPDIENLKKIVKLFFFQYHEEFNSLEFGLSWYLTTLIRLYLISPFVFLLFKKINSRKTFLVILILTGFIMRIAMGYHISISGEGNWLSDIFKPFYFNLDLFFSGFLISGLKHKIKIRENNNINKIFSILILFVLVIYNTYIYYGADYKGANTMNIFYYILPTLYICSVLYFIYSFDMKKNYEIDQLSIKALKRNVFRIFDYFTCIQLPIYLFHSTILLCLKNSYNDFAYIKICSYFKINESKIEFVKGCIFTFEAFVISLIFAIVVNLFFGKYTKIIVQYFENYNFNLFLEKWKKKIILFAKGLFNGY